MTGPWDSLIVEVDLMLLLGSVLQFVDHPADFCFRLPEHLTHEEGAMVEPLSVGVHAVRRAGVSPGKTVAIMGAGPIGAAHLPLSFTSLRHFGFRESAPSFDKPYSLDSITFDVWPFCFGLWKISSIICAAASSGCPISSSSVMRITDEDEDEPQKMLLLLVLRQPVFWGTGWTYRSAQMGVCLSGDSTSWFCTTLNLGRV